VFEQGRESKFEKMRELLRDPNFEDQKVIIYTEHRDTLEFLIKRLEAMGHAGQVAFIHGGLDYQAARCGGRAVSAHRTAPAQTVARAILWARTLRPKASTSSSAGY